jgi:regulator of cell morphogenesis and NO signaling
MSNITKSTSISVLAATLPGAPAVFDALGIDYSCAGERSIAEAAGLEGVDADAVIMQLRRLPAADDQRSWLDGSLKELIEHLLEQHQHLIGDDLTPVAEQLAEICSGSVPAIDALKYLREEFKILVNELLPHVHREEGELFPLLERLEAIWQSNEVTPPALEESVKQTIKDLLVEHGSIAARLRTVREIRVAAESEELSPQCRSALQHVSKLEGDLRQYMFLENSILFPRALALRDSLVSSVRKDT